jgi:hypothetical protein
MKAKCHEMRRDFFCFASRGTFANGNKLFPNSQNLACLCRRQTGRMGIAHQNRLSIWWAAPTPSASLRAGSTIDFQTTHTN